MFSCIPPLLTLLRAEWKWSGFSNNPETQRAPGCYLCSSPLPCQPRCLLIVSVWQRAHTDGHKHTHTQCQTLHSLVKSLSEIRLTSAVYLTSFEEARLQTHIHIHELHYWLVAWVSLPPWAKLFYFSLELKITELAWIKAFSLSRFFFLINKHTKLALCECCVHS